MELLLISSSNVHGYGYLDHAESEIRRVLSGRKRVTFIPYALKDRAAYVAKVRERLALMGFEVVERIDDGEAIFVGGGNTFRLLKTLYEEDLIPVIRGRVRGGMPYIGSSAGTNITAPTIKTTNDMPIVQPPSFEALDLVPYQINPHYLDPDPSSTHKGETREQRIMEFHEENDTPVIGLREGSMLRVENGVTTLTGMHPARLFRRGQAPVEVAPGPIDVSSAR
jgi:dipeptidase E